MIKNHPDNNIIRSLDEGLQLRKWNILLVHHVTYHCYLAQFESKRVEEVLQDENWVESMHEELNQFVRNDVWELTPRPENVHVISTKWIFKNKIDEDGEMIQNGKTWVYSNSYVNCMHYELQTLLNGCEICISKWITEWRSICWTTQRLWKSSLPWPCAEIEESPLWLKTSS